MVVIRLSRVGRRHSPRYRVTVADSRRSRSGKFLEIVGSFNPLAQGNDQEVILDMEKVNLVYRAEGIHKGIFKILEKEVLLDLLKALKENS